MEKIKHYNIIEKIGSGGMGAVYKAFDTILERDVAIKVMHSSLTKNKKNLHRLMQEARAAAKLVHPNVVTIYEIGEDSGNRFIVMEYVEGRRLTELIYKGELLQKERSIKLIIQVLNALSLSHSFGILHRDIKADNILVTSKDEIKILDFGIAKFSANPGITVEGDMLGTIEYMAPEQMLGKDIDQQCDVYATGVVLYQALTKSMPFPGQNAVEILFNKLNEEPVIPSFKNKKVSSQLDKIILKAIDHDKKERWKTAEEFIAALEEITIKKESGGIWPAADFNDFDNLDSDEELADEYLSSVFIGRTNEMKKLTTGFNRVKKSKGQTIVLSGEAGVGKSTLAKHFRKYVEYQKTWVLSGSCLYQEGMDAYLPFIDALRNFFSRENTKLTEEDRSKLKELIQENVPILTEFTERFTTTIIQKSSGDDENKQNKKSDLFEGINLLISLMSEHRPVIFIIDDLQWADDASLRLFHYLSRQIENSSVLLFGISRIDHYDLYDDGKPKLIVDIISRLRRESVFTQINLKRMIRQECDELIDKSFGDKTALSEDFYYGIFNETKGNPFFVLETIKLLCDKNEIQNENNIWVDKKIDFKKEVPTRIEDIFIRRLSTLTEEEREILQIAAIIGYKFDSSFICSLLDIEKIKLLKILQKIARNLHIIENVDNHSRFEHPMMADLLYNEVPYTLRQEYHLLLVKEYEKIHKSDFGALVGDVAQHARRGGDHAKAIPLLYQAGLRSFNISAFQEACLFFDDMNDSMDKSGQKLPQKISKIDFYFNLGICYEETGRIEESLHYFKKMSEVCQRRKEYERQATAIMRMGRLYDKLGDWKKSINAYEKCLELAEKHEINNIFSRVYNKLGVNYFHRGDYDGAISYFMKTLKSIDSEQGELDKAHVFTNIGIIANILRGDHGVALENFNKAMKIYVKHKAIEDQARVYHNIGMIYSDRSEWLESIKAYESCLKLVNEVDSKQLRALTYLNMGKAFARQKKFKKSKQLADNALKLFKQMSDFLSIAEVYQIFGMVYGNEGDLGQAEKYLNDASDIFTKKDYPEGLAENYTTYGDIYQDFACFDKAREYYLKAVDVYKKIKIDGKVNGLIEKMKFLDDNGDTNLITTTNESILH